MEQQLGIFYETHVLHVTLESAEYCEGRSGGRWCFIRLTSKENIYMYKENVVHTLRGGHYGRLRGTVSGIV
jgi:hypothetical protein